MELTSTELHRQLLLHVRLECADLDRTRSQMRFRQRSSLWKSRELRLFLGQPLHQTLRNQEVNCVSCGRKL